MYLMFEHLVVADYDCVISDVVKSRRPAIFAGYCPFLAGYFSMSKKIM